MTMASRARAYKLWRAASKLRHHGAPARIIAPSTTTSSFDSPPAWRKCLPSLQFASNARIGFEFALERAPPWRLRHASTATSESTKPAEEVAEGITLTDNCIRRIQEIKREDGPEGENKMLRLSVEGGGCSGFLYNFALDDKVHKDDRVFERDGAKLVVDDISFGFIKGATVDFTEELIRASFAVTMNPNAASACGCGASFNAK